MKKIILVSPCGSFDDERLLQALTRAKNFGIDIVYETKKRFGRSAFINGLKDERLNELARVENISGDAIWCVRGGCGALELWSDYQSVFYQSSGKPMIGYSDVSILHFIRFYRAGRIGIHGPIFFDIADEFHASFEMLKLLVEKKAEALCYPALKPRNHFLAPKLTGELIVMNLASLGSIIGCFDTHFFQGKILALEDVNEPHHRVFRTFYHLKNSGLLSGLKALLVGHFEREREAIIEETIVPLVNELGIPLFDWPIFGHEKPNWPLLFGAKSTINKIDDQFFTLNYDEQHDHSVIYHDHY